jgi:hypothetical protein
MMKVSQRWLLCVVLLTGCKPGSSPDDLRAKAFGTGPQIAPSQQVAAQGDLFATVCAQCHGPVGQGNDLLKAPSIAARPAWYVLAQLQNFHSGRRGSNPADLPGTQMATIAKTLSIDQMNDVAKKVQSLALVLPSTATALNNPDLEEGRILFTERCMECHRYNASGEMTFGSPPLVGLQDWYLLAQIDKFKSGWRGVDPADPNGTKMKLSSQYIESEQAKHDVVAFILSLNPTNQDTASAANVGLNR